MIKPSRELVDAFKKWFSEDPHSANEDYYTTTITRDHLSGLSQENLIEFFFQFARDGGMIQSGGHRTAGGFRRSIEADISSFREFVLEPFDSEFDIDNWLDRISDFKGMGIGLATIYLNRVDKHRFAIVNNKAVEAVRMFGVSVPSATVNRYKRIHEAWSQVMEWFPEFDSFYATDSLSQFLVGEDAGEVWAEKLNENHPSASKRFWIYAPGRQARFWKEFQQIGMMGIGWSELDEDLSEYSTIGQLRERYNEANNDQGSEVDFRQLWAFLHQVQIGDGVFVKKGRGLIVGYGEVTSDYFFMQDRAEYKHMRKVQWLRLGEWSIPDSWKMLPMKTLTEIDDPNYVSRLESLVADGSSDSYFSKETFRLLKELHTTPSAAYYREHKESYKKHLISPFKDLMRRVADRLDPEIVNSMETEKNVFSRIPKNDFGRGGAWDHYWGAFYPLGGQRIKDPQLFTWINGEQFGFGFYIGEYGELPRKRFAENARGNRAAINEILAGILASKGITFGERILDENGKEIDDGGLSFDEWVDTCGDAGTIRVGIALSPDQVTSITREDLASDVADLFNQLFPLVLLASSDTPILDIHSYLKLDQDDEGNDPYTLEECAYDTFMSIELLNRWLRALEHKKQAIFYGPPGTGKTFIAELLAKHLVSEGDGFTEVIQFHPSYAYEDFIQGLKPKTLENGGLEYSLAPGRFKEFCSKARGCRDLCVLIIDEINRANLSRTMGELMYLLEYRGRAIPLAGGEMFRIPVNVRIIGTMNTADRSIALVDHALRRRFAFLALYPEYDVLRRYHERHSTFDPEGLIDVLTRLNSAIIDKHYFIGISYFLKEDIEDRAEDIWRTEIEPYIEELFFDQPDKVSSFLWDRVKLEILG